MSNLFQGIDWANLGLTIGALAFGIIVIALIGGIFIRLSCWLHNQFVGGPGNPSAVPHPTIGRAMLIGLISMLLNTAVALALMWSGLADVLPHHGQTIAVPLNFVATAAVLSALLPTRFGRGLAVAAVPYMVMGLLTAMSLA